MKKLTAIILALLFVLMLTACNNVKQEQLVVYSFYGESDCFEISNGTIILSDSEDVFYGGNLKVNQPESIQNITSYKAAFSESTRRITLVTLRRIMGFAKALPSRVDFAPSPVGSSMPWFSPQYISYARRARRRCSFSPVTP